MPLRDRWVVLNSPSDVDAFLAEHATSVLFKAGSCNVTDEAFHRIRATLEANPELPVGLIRVVEARAASSHVAERTGQRHESPQLLVFKNGQVVLCRNHWSITAEALTSALASAATVNEVL